MISPNDHTGSEDTFNLARFIEAQSDSYSYALEELRNGRKQTHWMWFIFPQLYGLGHSSTSKYYGIRSLEEAEKYLADPVLGERLIKCTEAVLAVNDRTVSEIFGSPDNMKFKSSMTLFERASTTGSLFTQALEKYFNGERDRQTLKLLTENFLTDN